MSAWWDGLTALQQFFYCVAIPTTLIMLIQTVLMLLGLGGHGDIAGGHGPIGGGVGHDIQHDAQSGQTDMGDIASFRLFTFQSILVFLVVFGWMGIAMSENHTIPGFVSILVSLLAGSAGLFLTAWLFYSLMKLQNSGNVRLTNAVGLEGDVYIPIPPNGKGQGKVNLLLQGRWVECDAVTNGLEPLKTQQAVRIVGLQGGAVLVVEPKI
jgi:membrane protein implicated in regulation of membrane protease activity